MEFNKTNRLIFESLESIAPIVTSRVSMFDTKDRYSHVPFCRFRFKDLRKSDEIYKKIQSVVDSFEGKLKWKLDSRIDSENFLIFPIISHENMRAWNDKEALMSLLGESVYRKKIDECVDDVPKLADVIIGCR